MTEGEPLRAELMGEGYFCANPACELHVRTRDPGVEGQGNWATLEGGRIASRSRYGDRMLCDRCGRAWLQGLLLPR